MRLTRHRFGVHSTQPNIGRPKYYSAVTPLSKLSLPSMEMAKVISVYRGKCPFFSCEESEERMQRHPCIRLEHGRRCCLGATVLDGKL